MKVYCPNSSKGSGLGGGWTFRRNLIKGGKDLFQIVNTWQECDVILITGPTMTDRSEMQEAQKAGKKIVYRIDNIPRDSRNRGTAFSRTLDFARMADYFIFQSEWSRNFAGWWFVNNGVDIVGKNSIIYNGIDKDYFYPNESERKKDRYLYVQYARDENKRMNEAFYTFHNKYKDNKDIELWLVGQYNPELIGYNFDFFAGEKTTYLGIIEDPKQMGAIMRQCEYILYPAFCDASPNTLAEAMMSGCEAVGINPEGGSIEVERNIKTNKQKTIQEVADDYKLIFKKVCQK